MGGGGGFVSPQHHWARRQLPQQERHACQVLEAAWAADAPAAMLQNVRTTLQRRGAEADAKILAREGLEREGVLMAAAGAKRQLEA